MQTPDGASDENTADTETVVILHDACYGHRFSRPKTSKSALSTIVERPERIHASILGLSAAYVRLGELHPDGKNAIVPQNEDNETEWERKDAQAAKPFSIMKSSRRVALGEQAVTNVHGVKWMEELKMLCAGAEAKLAHNGKELIRPIMDRGKGAEEPQKFHEGDLYLCSESLQAMEGALGAVCDGVDAIFSDTENAKRAFIVVRPPGHHCSASYPSGFCWVNNVHVGIQHAALQHGLTHAAIIDFDLHHGDGSQDIAWSHNERSTSLPKNAPAWKKTSIGYFSIHDINSYPCEMGDIEKVKNASLCIENAHGQNIWNVHLQPWKTEEEFWKLYEMKYMILLEKTRLFLQGQSERINEAGKGVTPKAAIFLSAGFDASEHESSGMQRHKVNVPTEFYARFTRDVRRIADEEGTSVNGRIISVLEGGYSDRALCSGVFSHVSGLAGADPDTYTKPVETTGLGAEVARRMGILSITSAYSSKQLPAYDPFWWSLANLEALEAAAPPPPAPLEPKKPRENGPPATYYASTQSFDAKITESPKGRRSSSGLFAHPPPHGYKPPTTIPIQQPRAPTPPPPEVTWAVAAKELCKALIPTDRQTMSCRPEDLNAAATRERKERQSLTIQSAKDMATPPQSGPVSPEPTPSVRKSTRERKPARPVDNTAEEAAKAAAASRTSRRRTVAGAVVIATEPARPAMPSRGVSHRDSARPVPPTSSTASRSSTRRASLASNTDSVISGMEPPAALAARSQGHDGTAEQKSRGGTRPSTSQTMRTESAASTRGAPSGVAVRKTRAPAVPRGAAAGLTTSRTPLARQPSGGVPGPSAVRKPSGPPQIDGSSERRVHRDSSMEMDTLTSSMSKTNIVSSSTSAPQPKPRITLTTKSQREAKAAETGKQTSSAVETPVLVEGAQEFGSGNDAKLTQSIESEMGMDGAGPLHLSQPALPVQSTEQQQTRPDYSRTTSQLHASQQLSTFSNEQEIQQQDRHQDQQQHYHQLRNEQQADADRETRDRKADQDAADQQSILQQLQAAAKAAAEIAHDSKNGTMSPPPIPTTADSGGRPGSAKSAGVASPSSIQDRIARLAHVSNVALESAREMGSGRSSFSDVRSPPRASSGASGHFVREGMGGPVGVKREQLPVFSSTGVIPFAEPVEGKEPEVQEEKKSGVDVKEEKMDDGDVEMGGY